MQRTSLPCEKGKKRDIPFLLLPPPGFNSCSFFSATQPTEEQRATAKKNRVEGDLRRWAHLCCPIPSGSTRGFRTEFGLLLGSPAAQRPHSHLLDFGPLHARTGCGGSLHAGETATVQAQTSSPGAPAPIFCPRGFPVSCTSVLPPLED